MPGLGSHVKEVDSGIQRVVVLVGRRKWTETPELMDMGITEEKRISSTHLVYRGSGKGIQQRCVVNTRRATL